MFKQELKTKKRVITCTFLDVQVITATTNTETTTPETWEMLTNTEWKYSLHIFCYAQQLISLLLFIFCSICSKKDRRWEEGYSLTTTA